MVEQHSECYFNSSTNVCITPFDYICRFQKGCQSVFMVGILVTGYIAMPVGGIKWLSTWENHCTDSFKNADSFRKATSKYPCKWVIKLFTQPICFMKGIVQSKIQIWCLSAYTKGILYVGDFVSSVEHKLRFWTQIVAVWQAYNGSQWDPRLWEKKKHTQTKPN